MQIWPTASYSQVWLPVKYGKYESDFWRPVRLLFSLGRWPLTQSINMVAKRKGIHSLASSQQCDFLSAHLACVCVCVCTEDILWEMFSLVRLLLALHCWGLNNEKLKSCCSCGRFKYKGCCLKKITLEVWKVSVFWRTALELCPKATLCNDRCLENNTSLAYAFDHKCQLWRSQRPQSRIPWVSSAPLFPLY